MEIPIGSRLASLVMLGLLSVAPLPAAGGTSERRVSIDLDGVPAEELFRSLAEELGAPLNFDPALAGSISLRLDNVKITTALDAACDSLGCTWVVVEGEKPRLQVLRSNTAESRGRGQVTDSLVTDRTLQLVTLSLKEAELADVMRTFARILRCDLDMPSPIEKKLTIEIQNVTAMQALDQIWKLTGATPTIHWGPLADQCRLSVDPPAR
jgi:type II secretory pathway component HofQ